MNNIQRLLSKIIISRLIFTARTRNVHLRPNPKANPSNGRRVFANTHTIIIDFISMTTRSYFFFDFSSLLEYTVFARITVATRVHSESSRCFHISPLAALSHDIYISRRALRKKNKIKILKTKTNNNGKKPSRDYGVRPSAI